MTVVRRVLMIALLSLAATALFAQTAPAQRTTEAVTAETDADVNDPRAMRLSLDEAIRTSMERNLGIQLQKYEYAMAGETLRASYGVFDWLGRGSVSRVSSESPTISTFQASGSRSTALNFGIAQFLPTGGSYDVGFSNSRISQSGGGTTVNPAYRSGLELAFNQPLLRNFGVDVNRRGITIARNTLGVNRETFRLQLMNTAYDVTQAYLDLVYARRAVDVVKESLFLARDQSRITQIRIDVGASAPLDILQPRVRTATVEEELIRSVAAVRDAEDRLRALLNLAATEWDKPILPTDPVEFSPVPIDTEAAVVRAYEQRPEPRQQKLFTASARTEYLYARNQRLPELNFGLGYDVAGLAGRSPELDPVTNIPTGRFNSTTYPDAVQQLFDNEFPSWNVGLSVSVPITNIGARAQARRAELDLEQSELSLDQVKQNIAVQVRATARAVDTAARAIVATRASRDAAERNLEAERRRFENGMTTNFQVLEVQQQLSDARVRELQALVEYNQAVTAFQRATGDILQVRNITDEEPVKVEEPDMLTRFDRYNWLNYGSRLKDEEKQK
jgi:HAE1 family hydrophobic/amphiphilic exporter-1